MIVASIIGIGLLVVMCMRYKSIKELTKDTCEDDTY